MQAPNTMDNDSLVLIALVSSIGFVWIYWQWCENKPEVIFFPDARLPCNEFYAQLEGHDYVCPRANCPFVHCTSDETSLMRLFKFLDRAEKSIDLCIYEFTFTPLANFLINARSRGIKVRIITDAHADRQQRSSGSGFLSQLVAEAAANDHKLSPNDQIPRLQSSGIKIKVPLAEGYSLMHNKFALIDDKRLVTGSFNWTKSAVVKNHEALIMLSDSRVVSKFVRKFAQIWKAARDRPRNAY